MLRQGEIGLGLAHSGFVDRFFRRRKIGQQFAIGGLSTMKGGCCPVDAGFGYFDSGTRRCQITLCGWRLEFFKLRLADLEGCLGLGKG